MLKKNRHKDHNFQTLCKHSVFALCHDLCRFLASGYRISTRSSCHFPQGGSRYFFVVSSLKPEKNWYYFLGCFVVKLKIFTGECLGRIVWCSCAGVTAQLWLQ